MKFHMLNTRIHVEDTDFALDKGLFADNFESEVFKKTSHRGKEDFLEFAARIGVENSRVDKLLAPFLEKQEKVEVLVERSFLNEPTKRAYLLGYGAKRNCLIKT